MSIVTEKLCRECGKIKSLKSFPTGKNICDLCRKERNIRGSFVYLIEGAGLVKIGLAKDIQSRIRTFEVGSPVELRLVYSFWSKDSFLVEKSLHDRYKSKRVRREWFRLSGQDVDWIKSNYR